MKLKKLLSLLLCVTMFFSVIGTLSFADEVETEEIIIEDVIEEEIVEEEFLQLLAAETPTLYVSSDYNSETEGWGTTHFSNYAGAYAYATANAKNALILIEKTTTVSGNTFDNNHKNFSRLAVTVKDGAEMGNALSKWDMTYKVTVEPGGKLSSARSAASGCYSHIKNTLTVGAENADKAAEIDFHSKSNGYKDLSIAVLYNGKLVANNALIKVADFGFEGSATINDSQVEVKGIVAFGKNKYDAYAQTMTNSTMTVKGHNFMNEDKYYSTNGNKFHCLTMDNSTITIDDDANDTTAEMVTLGALTMKNGSSLIVEEGTPVSVAFIKALGNKKTTTTIENSTLIVGDITIASQAEMVVNNADLAMRRATGVSADEIHIEEGGKLKVDLVGGLSANKITGSGTLEIDASEYTSGKHSTNLDLSGFTGKVNIINTNDKDLTVELDENGIGVVVPAVAKIGDDKLFADFKEALKALEANDTLTLLDDITITEKWDARETKITVPVTIDGGEDKHTIKFACQINDGNNNTCAFRVKAPATFKNLLIDMSEATHNSVYMRAIANTENLTVENCTIIGNPDPAVKKQTAIIYGEYDSGEALNTDMEVVIKDTEFINWARRCIGDNERGNGDIKSVSVTGCKFNDGLIVLSASDTINFTGNTLNNTSLTLYSITNADGININVKENTLMEATEKNGISYVVNGVGAGIKVEDEEVLTWVAEYNGKQYFTLDAAIAKAKATIAADAAASRDIKLFNNIADVNDDTLYYVYDEQPDKLEITFDFGGGVNSGNYEFVKYYCSYMESITAPTDIKKEGYFFKGWDTNGDGVYDKSVDAVPDKAWEPKTYTAIWQSLDEYGFKITLNPAGGTKIEAEERSMKVNPGEYFLIEVTVNDRFGNENWNDADITFTYDNTLFDFVYGDGVEKVAGSENKLRFRVYGADRVNGSLTKQISFKAKEMTTGSKTGKFVISEATVDTGWAANRIDATPAMENADASVSVFYTYDVTLGEGLKGSAIATTDANYVGNIDPYDGEYNYEVWVECDGDKFKADINETTGEFTVKKELIKGDMTIELTLIGLKGVAADDIEIYEYIGSVALVLLDAEDTREYTYNSGIMYRTPWYDKANTTNGKVRFAYLVDTKDFVKDNTLDDTKADYYAKALNTEENKKIALSKIGVTKDGDNRTNETLVFEPGDVNKAGNTTVIDINDVQATWNCYNGNDSEQINVNMPLYLRADINRDMQVNVTDTNAVYALVK